MKILKKILILMIIISVSAFIGCGGGSGGGGSDDPDNPVKFTVTKFVQDKDTSLLYLSLRSNKKLDSFEVTDPTGYTSQTGNYQLFEITGPAIPNPSDEDIEKIFKVSYSLNGAEDSQKIRVTVEPNDIGSAVRVTVSSPREMFGSAYNLKYSVSDHLISVNLSLPERLAKKDFSFVWTLDSETGRIINNTDSAYSDAEFIYRPADTSVIPPDVTTGTERVYNRGFKINSSFVGRYIYLKIKDQNGIIYSTEKFYADEPTAPPTPN